jgi:hypothetical protein
MDRVGHGTPLTDLKLRHWVHEHMNLVQKENSRFTEMVIIGRKY